MHQHRFVKEATRAVGPAGGPATGTRAEILRYEWVRDQLVERGRERARALGWSDTYGLSKAIGERTLIAAKPRQLTIVRPAIVESALHTPYPGWMESLKVADPILLGYGAGIIPGRFAANRAIRMDLIPVDFVANACVAAAAIPPENGTVRTMNVSTGMRNPFTIADMAVITLALLPRAADPGRGRPAGRRARVAADVARRGHDRAQPRRRRAQEGPRGHRPPADPAAATRSSCGCTRTSARSTACGA